MKTKLSLVIACVLLLGCENSEVVRTGDSTVSQTKYAGGYFLYTVRHDGHLFVVRGANAVIHHPGCPCLEAGK